MTSPMPWSTGPPYRGVMDDRPGKRIDDEVIEVCTTDQVDAASGVLARAFSDDPIITWMFSDDARKHANIHEAFAMWLRRIHVPKGCVDVHPSRAAVACWSPPERWRLSMTQKLRLLPSMASVFGLGRLGCALEGLQGLTDRHPDDEAHWYLTFLGTEPARQRSGLGASLLRHRLERCDATCTAAYLEASHPDNVPYYATFGFEVLETFDLPDGPPVTTMWRPAAH